ncbi:Thioredoxin family protein [Histomonas meleagridis]|uniref:Thioredoxin family protein n=1 Tax=Histomonas meleagridis TaxID=135588 RepID=UPI0035596D21|nr:Thioredoxin family protein [Histomonas meleagridis]KAH0795018.1 Thioredoxin family protein [Histomonas meleagridis]KAH0804830.1 Thioredoxin family protein [Histomonas meleagridis]
MSLPNLKHFSGTKEDLKNIIKKSSNLVVLDFYADWCGPCQVVGKALPEIAKQYPNVEFLKVNVDKSPEFSYEFGVDLIPDVKFFKKNEKVDDTVPIGKVIGANVPKIKELIDKLL